MGISPTGDSRGSACIREPGASWAGPIRYQPGLPCRIRGWLGFPCPSLKTIPGWGEERAPLGEIPWSSVKAWWGELWKQPTVNIWDMLSGLEQSKAQEDVQSQDACCINRASGYRRGFILTLGWQQLESTAATVASVLWAWKLIWTPEKTQDPTQKCSHQVPGSPASPAVLTQCMGKL